MKKYTDAVKENNIMYFYIYCEKCDEVYIDDIFYIIIQKPCPNKCGSVPFLLRSNKQLNKEQVKERSEIYKQQQESKKIRDSLKIN